MAAKTISVYYGTETGHSRIVAEGVVARCAAQGISAVAYDLVNISASHLSTETNPSVFAVSTWESGKPPFMVRPFFAELESGAARFPQLRYAVIALGDEHYRHFCACGRSLDEQLAQLGAQRFMEHVELGRNYLQAFNQWVPELCKVLEKMEN